MVPNFIFLIFYLKAFGPNICSFWLFVITCKRFPHWGFVWFSICCCCNPSQGLESQLFVQEKLYYVALRTEYYTWALFFNWGSVVYQFLVPLLLPSQKKESLHSNPKGQLEMKENTRFEKCRLHTKVLLDLSYQTQFLQNVRPASKPQMRGLLTTPSSCLWST